MTLNTGNSGWSDEEDVVIDQGIADNKSASQIACDLKGRSRNAVIGRVHRRGLTLGGVPSDGPRNRPRKIRTRSESDLQRRMQRRLEIQNRQDVNPKAETFEELPDPVIPMHVGMLENRGCKWPYGEGPFTFCGHKLFDGSPYCLEHTARGTVLPQASRRDTVIYERPKENF